MTQTYALRRKGDYQPMAVEREEITEVMQRVPDILDRIGRTGVSYATESASGN